MLTVSSYNVKYPQGANAIATTRSSTRRQLPTTVRHSREFQGPAQRGFKNSFIHHSIALLSLLFRPARPHDLLLWPHGCALDGWLVLVITMECVHLWHRSIEPSKNMLHRRADRSLEQLLVPSAPYNPTNLLLLHGHPFGPNFPNILKPYSMAWI
jgi:hypothetical protein